MPRMIANLGQYERLNFLLTNRIPRRWATRLMGKISRIENKLWTRFVLKTWSQFADELNLEESVKSEFNSLHDCFIRELKPGARVVDQQKHIVTSPCDAIVGAIGKVDELTAYQAKGYPYQLSDLIPDGTTREKYRNGNFITLRLKSTMYHRFHAPVSCRLKKINYISGDTWNVNPIALKRVENLYCKNERAILDLDLQENDDFNDVNIALVPVAAILVASMRFHAIEDTLDLQYKGENKISCDASYNKGDEMGYFQHGSTIIIFTSKNVELLSTLCSGQPIKMGQPIMQKL